jgi:hypothetical protein
MSRADDREEGVECGQIAIVGKEARPLECRHEETDC